MKIVGVDFSGDPFAKAAGLLHGVEVYSVDASRRGHEGLMAWNS